MLTIIFILLTNQTNLKKKKKTSKNLTKSNSDENWRGTVKKAFRFFIFISFSAFCWMNICVYTQKSHLKALQEAHKMLSTEMKMWLYKYLNSISSWLAAIFFFVAGCLFAECFFFIFWLKMKLTKIAFFFVRFGFGHRKHFKIRLNSFESCLRWTKKKKTWKPPRTKLNGDDFYLLWDCFFFVFVFVESEFALTKKKKWPQTRQSSASDSVMNKQNKKKQIQRKCIQNWRVQTQQYSMSCTKKKIKINYNQNPKTHHWVF